MRSGRVSSEELVTQALKRLEETEGDVGAFLSVQGRAAVDTARAIDRKVRTKHLLSLPRRIAKHLLRLSFAPKR